MTPPVDWSEPWLAPWRTRGERVERAMRAGAPLHEALNAEAAAPVTFVPQAHLPPGTPYERYIFDSCLCPVREGLHDFFNGLCWLQFPQTKSRLNALQAAAIARDGVGAERGPVRDAITVLDENAAFLLAPLESADALWQALRARDWPRLFIGLRPAWQEAQLVLFGHALLEKLVQPRKPLTAHVVITQGAPVSIANLDADLSRWLDAGTLAGKPFAPLPVLGVPGWWPANDDPGFYDDPKVFRVAP